MARTIATLAVATLLVTAALLVARRGGADPRPTLTGASPVIVELFTSQGCSSCPPADALLRTVSRDPAYRGMIIPLAFHVDYWDRLGWRDPFSMRQATQRQMQYVHAMQLSSAYTPQVVVGGTTQMVGSDERGLREAITAAAARKPEGSLMLTEVGGTVSVDTTAPVAGLELLVAVYENEASTKVERGENGGRTLQNDAIVRQFLRVTNIPAGKSNQHVSLTPDPAWKRAHLGLAAMLQDPRTLRIVAAARGKL
ncbi:MAG: hypothetical protein JWN02_711 [Acidobacteria bacterium]|nr:hypothetical protein [Acidobacteriota bacterium]